MHRDQRSLDAVERRLRTDVETLAGTIGERNIWRAASLQPAADHIRSAFTAAGYRPHRQTYDVHRVHVENVEAEVFGTSNPREIVLVGAHYDTVTGCPGANDNASGVASMLELARRFAGTRPARTLRFVGFVNEEPPFFQTAQMGSVVYARAARQRAERIVAMLSLETMGYYSDEPGSQTYPAPLDEQFSDVGNFIGFVSDFASADLLDRVRRAFEERTSFPVQSGAGPAALPGVGWSDQWAFWQEGYPGVMVTDTAPFRYPWYHTSQDTVDKVQFDRLARVVEGLEGVVEALGNGLSG
jgi:Zn-dependent M28 family amino/carboxypeptidase